MLRRDDTEKVSERLRVVVGDAQPPGLPRRAQPERAPCEPSDTRAADSTGLDDESRTPDPGAWLPNADSQRLTVDQAETSPSVSPEPGNRSGVLRATLVRLTRTHAGALTVLLVVALVLTGSRVMAARGHAVDPVPDAPVLTPAASASSPAPPPPLQVHVMGAVVEPGVVSIPAGSRVGDALAAAGGLREDADCAELNLAAEVPDGAQIMIGTLDDPRGELRTGQSAPSGGAGGAAGSGGGAASTLVNLNTAGAAQLETLPGVGPVMAQRIIDWRTTNGGFTRVEELQEVDGIGAKTYARLAPLVQV